MRAWHFAVWFITVMAGALYTIIQTGPDTAGENLCKLVKKIIPSTNAQCVPSFEQWGPHTILIIGVIFGALVIWDIVGWIRNRTKELIRLPNMNAAEGFKKIIARSKWSAQHKKNWQLLRPVMYEASRPEVDVIKDRLHQELDRQLHDYLRQGRLTAWGRPSLPGVAIGPEEEIESAKWREIELHFDHRSLNSVPPNICAWRRNAGLRGGGLEYVRTRFSRAQLFSEFPLRSRLRRRVVPEGQSTNVPIEKPDQESDTGLNRFFQPTVTQSDPSPIRNMSMTEALEVLNKASEYPGFEDALYQALYDGKVLAWGRKELDRLDADELGPYQIIDKDYWTTGRLAWITTGPGGTERAERGKELDYTRIRFNTEQIRKLCQNLTPSRLNDERRELIDKARTFVSETVRESREYSNFVRKLESDEIFFKLRPYLTKKFISALHGNPITIVVGTTMPGIAIEFLRELERLEKEWGLNVG